MCWYKVHSVFSLSLWLPFYYFPFFLRGRARMQSHEYKTYTANSEVSGPGGEETMLLFHFRPVSLTDDFWAPHHFCHLPSPPFFFSFHCIYDLKCRNYTGGRSAECFRVLFETLRWLSAESFFSSLALKRKLCVFRQSIWQSGVYILLCANHETGLFLQSSIGVFPATMGKSLQTAWLLRVLAELLLVTVFPNEITLTFDILNGFSCEVTMEICCYPLLRYWGSTVHYD